METFLSLLQTILILVPGSVVFLVLYLAQTLSYIMPKNMAFLISLFLIGIVGPLLILRGVRGVYRKIAHRLSRKTLLNVSVASLSGLVLIFLCSYLFRMHHPRPLVFDGESKKLSRTQVVPTLDTPIQAGKNVIWCASFQGAWKTLQRDVTKGPVELEGATETCARLNGSADPEVPEGALYTAAGWVQDGILDTIRRGQTAQFPGRALPTFPGITPNSLVAYGYLESKCKFTLPYFDSTVPLTFTDSAGNTTPIRTFGIRTQDESKYIALRKQVDVLVAKGSITERPDDFAVDLCRESKETQVVFARIPLGASLQEMLKTLDADLALAGQDGRTGDRFGVNDVLLVPEIAFRMVHDFDELQGHTFLNALLAGQRLDLARQEILFRLDRSGTELMSQFVLLSRSMKLSLIGDRPFLVFLKKRGAVLPYFVMWVDNSELLMKWE